MSDLKKYIANRKKKDPVFEKNYESGFSHFKIGVLLKQAREASGRTQEEVAQILGTQKSAVSRIENHAEDIRLSTLEKFAKSVGRKLEVRIV
ncbi:MAG: helix-turn-helix transcriptional regulator [Chitinispirillaceae bacterium]|nr:helix-turn-helix transcriptional regulator [Chitinispirillaceae bacterium]